MYEITNRARRVTTISLPGRSIILQPRGKAGSIATVSDREYEEDGVRASRDARVISCRQTTVDGKRKATTPKAKIQGASNPEERRIAATQAAQQRARERNARASRVVASEQAGLHKPGRAAPKTVPMENGPDRVLPSELPAGGASDTPTSSPTPLKTPSSSAKKSSRK